MSKLPPSPFAHLPYDEKLAATQALGQAYMPKLEVDMRLQSTLLSAAFFGAQELL
jgi:hypothetical protein